VEESHGLTGRNPDRAGLVVNEPLSAARAAQSEGVDVVEA